MRGGMEDAEDLKSSSMLVRIQPHRPKMEEDYNDRQKKMEID